MAAALCFRLYLLASMGIVYGEDYCMWGRVDASHYNTIINGQYLADGTTNQKPSYKKVTDVNCSGTNKRTLDLYWSSGFGLWGIGNAKNTNSWYAHCLFADLSACTAGNWRMASGNGWESEPNLYAQSGDCPSVC